MRVLSGGGGFGRGAHAARIGTESKERILVIHRLLFVEVGRASLSDVANGLTNRA